MTLSFFIINEKIRKYLLCYPITFFSNLDVASVNTILPTITAIKLFKFILTKSMLQLSYIRLCRNFENSFSVKFNAGLVKGPNKSFCDYVWLFLFNFINFFQYIHNQFSSILSYDRSFLPRSQWLVYTWLV